ncbi:MAG: MFS transporter [Anaerolineaceae bacterium]|nr:MFS transporter [Anaerolineaceae bacterium]
MTASRPSLFYSKIFYFCFYAGAAALLPFLVLFYNKLGLSGRQIGVLASIPPMLLLISAPLWGVLADTFRRHKFIMSITTAGTIILAFVISQTTTFILLVPIVAVYALFAAPIIPLMDDTVLTLLADWKNQYGRQRVWGAIGWGLSAPIIGYLIERNDLQWAFLGYAGFMFIGLLILQKITFPRVDTKEPFWHGVRVFLSNRTWLLFLFLVFAGGAGQAVIFNYLFLYMNDMGASKTMMGFALTFATISELPVFFFSNRLLSRWSAKSLFVFATAVYIIRAMALSFVTVPWIILITQLFHGLTFSVMWVAGVAYANEIAPPGYGAIAQGLLSGVFMGVATASGTLLGGILYQDFGGAIMYRTIAIGVAVSMFIYLIFSWWFKQRERLTSL